MFDSNSKGHLALARFGRNAGLFIVVTWNGFIHPIETPSVARIAIALLWLPVWEWWASPDSDHHARSVRGSYLKRCRERYWALYRWSIPHRSRWSHSLVPGTFIRILYGLWPLLVIRFFFSGVLFKFWSPAWVDAAGSGILIGCFIADTLHMLNDGYNPLQVIRGK